MQKVADNGFALENHPDIGIFTNFLNLFNHFSYIESLVAELINKPNLVLKSKATKQLGYKQQNYSKE